MKRIIATALVAFATLTGAATAMTPDANLAEIKQFEPSVDVSTLSETQVATILNIIHGGGSDSEKRGTVRAFVN